MKAPWIVLSALLAAAGLCAAAMWQAESTRATALERTVAQLKADNAKLAADAAAANEKADSLESESAQLRAAHVLAETTPEASPAPMPQAEVKPKEKGGFLAGMAGMFKDPAFRKMMAAQQSTALRGFYADFVKQAHLTPDQADKFFQLLGDRQSALMDSSADMMSGGKPDMSAITAATDTANAALKDLLGPDQFSAYQSYEKTLGDRIQVQQFGQQLGSTAAPLQDYQSQALIQIMSQEQANMPNLQSPTGAGMQTALNMSPADMDQYSQQLTAMNQRVYNRAMSVLSQPQLSAFATFQQTMATAQLAGLKMAQQMMKGDQ